MLIYPLIQITYLEDRTSNVNVGKDARWSIRIILSAEIQLRDTALHGRVRLPCVRASVRIIFEQLEIQFGSIHEILGPKYHKGCCNHICGQRCGCARKPQISALLLVTDSIAH